MKAKKQMKQQIEDSSFANQRFGVFVEHMDKRFDQVFEGYSALDKKIDDFRSEFTGDLRDLRSQFVNFRGEMIDFRDDTQLNFKKIFEYLSRIDDEIQDIRKEIIHLKEVLVGKVEVERVFALEKRIVALEGELLKLRKS